MGELDQLKTAATALGAQRGILGDEVVDAGLRPLLDRIAALESPVAEERKQVTTLFADLVGFTTMSEQMDAEDVRAVLDTYFARWAASIEHHGGTVEKFIGDAVMAVFGMKQASEDDPERAILAALDMVTSLADLNEILATEQRPPLAMRVGINTGEVVVGAVGDRRQEEWVAVGDPINVAARLQTAAPVNGILIAHSTFRHVRGVFDVQEVPPLELKGKTAATRAYVVERAKPRAFRVPARGVEGVETHMVGRAAELKRMEDAFLNAADGEPGMVTIVGDAGMGKSRLFEEFAAWLDLLPDRIAYIKGRAGQGTAQDAFSLIRDTIAFRFDILDTDPPSVVRDKLSSGFGDSAAELIDVEAGGKPFALIGHLLGFDLGSDALPADIEAQATHELGTAAFIDWVQGIAAVDPVVFVLDDIHWADDSSLDLAARLVTEPDLSRVLVVCGARPALYTRRPGWQAGERRHHRIDLAPLSNRDSRSLVAEILQMVPDVPEDLRETIVGAAEGNPFHVEELVKMLIEDGVIVKGTDAWEVARDRLPTVRVPATLVGVLQARIDALTPEQKSVLHRAAVIGRRFWDQAVAALEDTPTGNGEVSGSLTELRLRELIYGRESSSIAGAAEYVFKHAVLRDVAYQSVLRRYRSGYHSRAAAWLTSVAEATDRADEFAALIAEHHDAAGEPNAAATWFLRAGTAAAARYANTEALALLGRAAALAEGDDAEFRYRAAEATQGIHGRIGDRVAESVDLDTLTGLADELDDDRRRVDVGLLRATQASDIGKPADAETHARSAADMARRLGDTEREARALLALGTALWRRGAPAEAVPVLTEALEIARGHGDDALAAGCLRNRGVAQQYLGRFAEAEADYREAASLWRRAGDRNGVSQVFNSLGILAYDREDFDAARSFFDQALVTKRAMGDRLGENRVLNNLALVAVALHDHDLAVDSFERTLELAREIDDLDGEAASHQGLGFTALRVGRVEPASHHLTESRRLYAEEGDEQGECQVVHLLAEVAYASGQSDLARTLADEALATASGAGLPTEEAAVHNLLGRLAADAGHLEEAETAYRRALELHAELGSTRRVNEVKAGLAEVLQARGGGAEARTLVAAVVDHFREHGGAGIDHPVTMLLSCLRVLQGHNDPAADEVIELAQRHIDQIATTIADPEIRRSYRQNVAANRIMLAEPHSEAGVSRPDT